MDNFPAFEEIAEILGNDDKQSAKPSKEDYKDLVLEYDVYNSKQKSAKSEIDELKKTADKFLKSENIDSKAIKIDDDEYTINYGTKTTTKVDHSKLRDLLTPEQYNSIVTSAPGKPFIQIKRKSKKTKSPLPQAPGGEFPDL